MNGGRNRFASHSRDRAVCEVGARRAWLLLIEVAADHARRTLDGQAIDGFEAAELARLAVATRAAFPLRHASATTMSDAFLTLARGFVVAARPEDRAHMAGFLFAGAKCLGGLLHDQACEAAALGRRIAGLAD